MTCTAVWKTDKAWAGTCRQLSVTLLFGLYILAFYAGALAKGDLQRWNAVLPQIYARDTPISTAGIAMHFAALGCMAC